MVCVCVCVCVKEKEKEREREGEREKELKQLNKWTGISWRKILYRHFFQMGLFYQIIFLWLNTERQNKSKGDGRSTDGITDKLCRPGHTKYHFLGGIPGMSFGISINIYELIWK